MRAALRTIPLPCVPVVAVGVMGGDLIAPLWLALLAVVKTLGWGLWVCSPLSLAVSLAIISRDAAPRILAEILLVFLSAVNLIALVAILAMPWISLRDVFFYLPFLEFFLISLAVAVALFGLWGKRRIAKKFGPATLEA